MALLITVIIIACVLLILVVLIQNPKGGGLSQSFGGLSNQNVLNDHRNLGQFLGK